MAQWWCCIVNPSVVLLYRTCSWATHTQSPGTQREGLPSPTATCLAVSFCSFTYRFTDLRIHNLGQRTKNRQIHRHAHVYIGNMQTHNHSLTQMCAQSKTFFSIEWGAESHGGRGRNGESGRERREKMCSMTPVQMRGPWRVSLSLPDLSYLPWRKAAGGGVRGQGESTGRRKPWKEGLRSLSSKTQKYRWPRHVDEIKTTPFTVHTAKIQKDRQTDKHLHKYEVCTCKNIQLTGTDGINSVTDSLSVWVCKYCLFSHGPN